MEINNTGLGLIKATIERAQNERSLFLSALKKLVNLPEAGLQAFLQEKITIRENLLRPLFQADNALPALSGDKTIKKFRNQINFGLQFGATELSDKGIFTSPTNVSFYELREGATFEEMFLALPGTWESKWFSQHQILEICDIFYDLLADKGKSSTFFLTKKDEFLPIDEKNPQQNAAVVYVVKQFRPGLVKQGLTFHLFDISYQGTFLPEYNYRLVVPVPALMEVLPK